MTRSLEANRENARAWYEANRQRVSTRNKMWRQDAPGTKTCPRCLVRRDVFEGRACSICLDLTRERRVLRNRLRQYGMTEHEYTLLVEAQGGCCAACGAVADLHIDHCHDTGRVRGLLCLNCNTSAGLVGDDPERLRSLAAYLEHGRTWRNRSL